MQKEVQKVWTVVLEVGTAALEVDTAAQALPSSVELSRQSDSLAPHCPQNPLLVDRITARGYPRHLARDLARDLVRRLSTSQFPSPPGQCPMRHQLEA